jgi:hypothetical protein
VGADNSSTQATWTYSWISPPRRSTRRTRTSAAEAVAGRLPAAVPGRVPGGADAGCHAPHSPTARSADVVDPGAASGPAAHDRPCRPTARRRRSLAVPAWRPQDPDASEAKIAAKVSVKVASRSRSRNLNCSMRSARSMRRVRPAGRPVPRLGWPSRQGCGPGEWRPPAPTAPTGACARRSQHGTRRRQDPSAWAARNCCQVRLARRGAGSIPHRLRSSHTVLGASFVQAGPSSPWMRREPHVGFSAAIGRIRRRSSGTVEGRPAGGAGTSSGG